MDHFASTPVAADIDTTLFMNVCDLASPSGVITCYVYAPTEYLLHFPQDYHGAIRACEKHLLPSKDSNNNKKLVACTSGVGIQAVIEHLGDFELLQTICLYTSTTEQQNNCFERAMQLQIMQTNEDFSKSEKCDTLSETSNTQFKTICERHAKLP